MGWLKPSEIGESFFKPTYPYEKWGIGRPTNEARKRRGIYNQELSEFNKHNFINSSFGKVLLGKNNTKITYEH